MATGDPGRDLDRRPVVLGTRERDEDRRLARTVRRAGRGHRRRTVPRSSDMSQGWVLEQSGAALRRGGDRRPARSRSGRDRRRGCSVVKAAERGRPHLVPGGSRGAPGRARSPPRDSLARVDQLSQDELSRRTTGERLGEGEQVVEASRIERRHQDRALRRGAAARDREPDRAGGSPSRAPATPVSARSRARRRAAPGVADTRRVRRPGVRPVESEHELTRGRLAERMFVDERLELGDRLLACRPSARSASMRFSSSDQAKLLEARDRRLGEVSYANSASACPRHSAEGLTQPLAAAISGSTPVDAADEIARSGTGRAASRSRRSE